MNDTDDVVDDDEFVDGDVDGDGVDVTCIISTIQPHSALYCVGTGVGAAVSSHVHSYYTYI